MEGHDPLLTTREVCAIFRVDSKTVQRWRKAGRLTTVRTPGGYPRFRESEIRALLAADPADDRPGSIPKVMTPPPVGPVPNSPETT